MSYTRSKFMVQLKIAEDILGLEIQKTKHGASSTSSIDSSSTFLILSTNSITIQINFSTNFLSKPYITNPTLNQLQTQHPPPPRPASFFFQNPSQKKKPKSIDRSIDKRWRSRDKWCVMITKSSQISCGIREKRWPKDPKGFRRILI